MSEGFYKRRRGILEHIEAGTIDLLESGIHDFLSLKANLLIGSPCSIPVGIVFTSAPAIHPYYRRVSERTIQRCLEHLEAIGWLKLFNTQGKRGNYPVLVCRASVHDVSGNEYRINGTKTTDWRKPVFEPVGDVSVSCPESVGGVSGYRELRVESREKREHQIPASAPPSNSLEIETQTAAFDAFWEKWPRKQAKNQAHRAWMKVPIGDYLPLMSGLEKWLVSDQWTRGVIPHPATWLSQKRWQDEDIPQFVGGSNGNRSVAAVKPEAGKYANVKPIRATG